MPGTLTAVPGESAQAQVRLLHYRDGQVDAQDITDLSGLKDQVNADGVSWIQVIGLGDLQTLHALGEQFNLHALAMEDVTHLGQRPKVDAYENLLFIVLPYLTCHENQFRTTQISLFLGRNFVISFQPQGPDILEPVRRRIVQGQGHIRKRKADYLAYAIIDLAVDTAFPVLDSFGDRFNALEDEMIEDSNSKLLTEVYLLRRQLLRLWHLIWPQSEMFSRLLEDDQDLIGEEVRIYLRDSSDHAVQAMDVVQRYREMAAGLIDLHMVNTNNRLTDVMRVLTVIATLFTPPTFVASLYGMNFDRSSPWNMPELGWEYGYLMVWGIVISMITGMLIYFRRKRWL